MHEHQQVLSYVGLLYGKCNNELTNTKTINSSWSKLVLLNHALVSVDLVLNSVLGGIAVHRQQADDGILPLCLVIDAAIGEELYDLIHMKFVI
jgi:hypothetical protein